MLPGVSKDYLKKLILRIMRPLSNRSVSPLKVENLVTKYEE